MHLMICGKLKNSYTLLHFNIMPENKSLNKATNFYKYPPKIYLKIQSESKPLRLMKNPQKMYNKACLKITLNINVRMHL